MLGFCITPSGSGKGMVRGQDVRTIIDVVKTETDVGEPPGFDLLQWHGMSRKSKIPGDEKLEVDKLHGQEVFACLRKPIDDKKHSLRANLVKLITGDGDTMSEIEPSMLSHITYASPFKHIRHDTSTASECDCPVKVFMVACFVLRRHTHLAQQLSMIQGGKNRLRIEIQRAGLVSVTYDKPYSHIELAGKDTPVAQTKALAQVLSTYLKDLFVLRGHSDGKRIAIDLQSFTLSLIHI